MTNLPSFFSFNRKLILSFTSIQIALLFIVVISILGSNKIDDFNYHNGKRQLGKTELFAILSSVLTIAFTIVLIGFLGALCQNLVLIKKTWISQLLTCRCKNNAKIPGDMAGLFHCEMPYTHIGHGFILNALSPKR
ncbi:hypothetical protein BLOT_009139 [Blomia tropicalis]|nr:hypothetical protein BLOT_009139 [Blomia tropicalis]